MLPSKLGCLLKWLIPLGNHILGIKSSQWKERGRSGPRCQQNHIPSRCLYSISFLVFLGFTIPLLSTEVPTVITLYEARVRRQRLGRGGAGGMKKRLWQRRTNQVYQGGWLREREREEAASAHGTAQDETSLFTRNNSRSREHEVCTTTVLESIA